MKTTVRNLKGDSIIVEGMKQDKAIMLKVKNALGQKVSISLNIDQTEALLWGLENLFLDMDEAKALELRGAA